MTIRACGIMWFVCVHTCASVKLLVYGLHWLAVGHRECHIKLSGAGTMRVRSGHEPKSPAAASILPSLENVTAFTCGAWHKVREPLPVQSGPLSPPGAEPSAAAGKAVRLA